jgi:tRNA(Arg) A34 adenosine deaminase TadA
MNWQSGLERKVSIPSALCLFTTDRPLKKLKTRPDWDKGIFGHAEFNLVHQCANRYSDAVLREATLYTSCAPCERCLCAIASLGVENVVFGVGYEAFSQLTPGEASP